MNLIKLSLIFPLLFLMACSAAYEKVKKIDSGTPNTFHQYLLSNYQQNASFEAEECMTGILQNYILKKH